MNKEQDYLVSWTPHKEWGFDYSPTQPRWQALAGGSN